MITQNNNLTFGWNPVTHIAITKKAANKINQLNGQNIQFNVGHLAEASILPDKVHKDTPHFADIDNLKGENGYTMFENFHKKAVESFKWDDKKGFEENAGKALHYLQDIMNPYHVIKRKQIKEEGLNHLKFEEYADHLQKGVLEENKLENQKTDLNFTDFLKKKMKETKEQKLKLEKNQTNHKKAIKTSLRKAYNVSIEYLDALSKEVNEI